ncbi:hypothetical protein NDU88_007053 [Pleurodeles waltl]|uniref:Uncharacterized protein n=1 Tax=Pleurodeles waltl TaxID=8319 RepID=A0AAV7RS16_PLEWA|nr:hypothetical protein NDU88_007053 [Pleurodeles waltl]
MGIFGVSWECRANVQPPAPTENNMRRVQLTHGGAGLRSLVRADVTLLSKLGSEVFRITRIMHVPRDGFCDVLHLRRKVIEGQAEHELPHRHQKLILLLVIVG